MNLNHHAFLIPHNYASIRDALREQLNVGDDAPEIIEMVEGTFPIDSVRQLIDLALRKSEERGQVFLVAFDSILPPAQNALLKVLEEPVPRTHFFLITANPHTLLPTVLSRLGTSPFTFEIPESSQAKEFLAATPAKRLSIIKPIIEEKDRRAAAVLLRDVAVMLEKKRDAFSDMTAWGQTMKQIQALQSYSEDPASSVKMLLEHAALTTPVVH
ncbi:MAG: hypothetical protein RLY47_176 [Candidatus Parcubacteria bacterium]|jgi:DNA polymerase III delta prime subunit